VVDVSCKGAGVMSQAVCSLRGVVSKGFDCTYIGFGQQVMDMGVLAPSLY
jgi:hypothetical protein